MKFKAGKRRRELNSISDWLDTKDTKWKSRGLVRGSDSELVRTVR